MTAPHDIDRHEFQSDLLAQASPDYLRTMLTNFINMLLSADADSVYGAAYCPRTDDRTNRRTATGTVTSIRNADVDIRCPKPTHGSAPVR